MLLTFCLTNNNNINILLTYCQYLFIQVILLLKYHNTDLALTFSHPANLLFHYMPLTVCHHVTWTPGQPYKSGNKHSTSMRIVWRRFVIWDAAPMASWRRCDIGRRALCWPSSESQWQWTSVNSNVWSWIWIYRCDPATAPIRSTSMGPCTGRAMSGSAWRWWTPAWTNSTRRSSKIS